MSYCMTKVLKEPQAAVEAKVREALRGEGFGVLSEIDVEATLRAKIGAEIGPYKILGACNPEFAAAALELEPRIGVMLPCNVVLRGALGGGTEVAFVDPVASMAGVDNPELRMHAAKVGERLRAAYERVA